MKSKHWQKLLLALSSLFWNSCNSSPDAVSPSSGDISMDVKNNSTEISALAKDAQDPIVNDSSDIGNTIALYGVPSKVLCVQKEGNYLVKCRDGVTCIDTDLLPAVKYGTPTYKKKKYKCDDGHQCTESEFRSIYNLLIISQGKKAE